MIPELRTRSASGRSKSALLALSVLCLAAPVSAHESAPGVIALREVSQGRFVMRWSPPSPPLDDIEVRFPVPCRCGDGSSLDLTRASTGVPLTLDCGAPGLAGTIVFTSRAPSPGRIAVNIEWLEGSQSLLLSAGSPASVTVRGPSRAGGWWKVLREYVALGAEHIWFGVDHLLFVLGLLLLVRGWRRTLLTVSAFTVAHSLTLVSAVLGLVSVPTAPVEICIALSVLLLAVEATRGPATATHRWPWLVAFGFGLLHGLGFASALSAVGLPPNAVPLALFAFNLGVELGQIAVVSAAALAYLLSRSRPDLQRKIAGAAVWVLGTCSVYWLLQRVASWLVGLGVLAQG